MVTAIDESCLSKSNYLATLISISFNIPGGGSMEETRNYQKRMN